MCDELTNADNDRLLAADAVTRRRFGVMTGAAGLSLLLPMPANAMEVAGRNVAITTPDGTADAYFVAPGAGKHPGVLIWPDINGLRPAFEQMATRLAQSGYAVLVVNQFYRSTKAPFESPGDKMPAWRALLTPDAVVSDGKAFTAFLDRQPQVDTKRGLATTGYCMGGPMVVRTAAAVADRVRAGASFHGAALVGSGSDSPHLLAPKLKGGYLFAIAENDDQRAPTDKDVLRKAFADAHVPAEIEVYQGAMHGWCPPDSRVYNPAQAEKAWARMLVLFEKNL
ncbi:dienelactone hydrolase family protein [Sphingomonas sp.]|uniref:dienelactone hydrolase family protein n=1 Tax=Sphingomonas sp. TaxID=28214 RepID=UPI002CD932A7|nr:dienelactone hydrolase family protein [Sphingomonas sp.]HWK35714.1 dienelactone hydrolase family protein [Sphingomonas sp.]